MELRWCNAAFTRISGYEAAEVIGQRGTILIGPDLEQGVHLQIIENLMGWESFSTEAFNNRKDGEIYWQRMSWSHLSDPETGDHWWLCSIIDLGPTRRQGPARDFEAEAEPSGEAYSRVVEKVHRLEKETTRLHELAKTVTRDANEDALTGLSNRRHFEIELRTWIDDLKRHEKGFAVLYLDLDRFKLVNDTLGHEAGDQLLVSVAELLGELTDDTDAVARLGGDEFVILRPLGDSALNISGLADEIVQRMKAPFAFGGKSIACSTSIGVAIAKSHLRDPEQVVSDADAALYHAKSNGRGRWSFFTEEMHAASIATKKLSSDLLLACERNEFVPYFQPVIETSTGRLASVEMLVRWAHPSRGILAPAEFLETAAQMVILRKIDEIVFAGLPRVLEFFDEANVHLPRIAINVSAARLVDPSFIHDIRSSGIDPLRLIVEIHESVYLDRMGGPVRRTIDDLAELGVTLALDDFGTGHASVRALLELKPKILKIDRHFIQSIVAEEKSKKLVASIVGIGKSLAMEVVAEGVETENHAGILAEMGCDYLQGFHFGKPMDHHKLSKVVMQNCGHFGPQVGTCARLHAAQ
ncbi:MAG: EAL domain-containing protein [Pseudomonadota bacterium]